VRKRAILSQLTDVYVNSTRTTGNKNILTQQIYINNRPSLCRTLINISRLVNDDEKKGAMTRECAVDA